MSAPPPPPNLAGMTLLLVDDDIDTIQILASFLRACGATVLAEVTVAGALAHVDEGAEARCGGCRHRDAGD